MSIFSKKSNDDLFKILEADAGNNEIGLENNKNQDRPHPSHAITAFEVLNLDSDNKTVTANDEISGESPLEALKKRMQNMSANSESDSDTKAAAPQKSESHSSPKTEPEETHKTLLQKCRPYILDESGNDATTPKQPLYRLESVAEILKNDSQRTIDRLSEKYNITFDDLKHNSQSTASKAENNTEQTAPKAHKMSIDIPEDVEIYEEPMPEIKINKYQTSLPDISDIDNFVIPRAETENDDISDSATIRFTPVKGDTSNSDSVKVAVAATGTFDFTNEFGDLIEPETKTDDVSLEKTEFESFKAEDEYTGPQDAKRLIHKLSVKKRSAFLRVVGSIILTLLLCLFELPTLNNLVLSHPKVMMSICTGILGLAVIVNIDMFAAFKRFLSVKSTPDVTAGLAAFATLVYSAVSVYFSQSDYELCLLAAIILSVRAIGQFMSRSTLLGNLKQIATPTEKKAVSLIMDEATTFAMAKDSIEGDVLAAAPRTTVTVADFMKYSQFSVFMNGKLPAITIISVIFALVSGFASAALFGEVIHGVYTAAAILCITALPIIFLADTLPQRSAGKKLNRKGAMIAGKTAAERLEMANAVVLSSSDLFPIGTVTLHNMKVLSENSIDDTIVKAASLTDSVNSPLANIFKQIAGTNAAYTMPDSDTVKYEDKMGLSGWVDNELLFIGNRTLMEAHGISVPDLKVDRNILEKGYFPVYIAAGNKAAALIVVQYRADPNVVYELKKITDSGITVLVSNCDPNITSDMICDYLGLYSDSVRIMSNAGVHMYKNAVAPTDICSAPATFKGRTINFMSVINSAAKIKKSSALLTVLYVLAMCVGLAIFAYLSFSGGVAPLSARTLLLYEMGIFAAAILIYQAFKP